MLFAGGRIPADRGISAGVPIPAGAEDPPPITLALRGYGSVSGKVTLKGKPVGNVAVTHAIKGSAGATKFTQTADDGTYTLSKVPEGQVVIQAAQQQMMSMRTTSTTVNVVAGRQSVVNLDIPVGTLPLTVTVKALPGNQVDAREAGSPARRCCSPSCRAVAPARGRASSSCSPTTIASTRSASCSASRAKARASRGSRRRTSTGSRRAACASATPSS